MSRFEGLEFYDMNVLRSLQYWTGGSYTDGKLTLAAGMKTAISLSTDYVASSLSRSKYKRVIIQTETTDAVNYNSNFRCGTSGEGIRVTLISEYNANTRQVKERTSLCLNPMLAALTGYANNYDFVFDTQNLDLSSCRLEIENLTNKTVVITAAQLFRSCDTTQLSDVTSVSVKLASLKAYYDGFEIQFDDSAEPIKVWWLSDDSGKFSGININNERYVPFTAVNGTLSGNNM